MSDERIDIEITDKIDPGIQKKLRDISINAQLANTEVSKLQVAVASLDASGFSALASANKTLQADLQKTVQAQAGVAQASVKNAGTTAQAAVATEQLAASTVKVEQASVKAAAAVGKTTTSMAAAIVQSKNLTASQGRQAIATLALANPAIIAGLAIVGAGFALLTRNVDKAADQQISLKNTFFATFQVIGARIVEGIGGAEMFQQAWTKAADGVTNGFAFLVDSFAIGFKIIGDSGAQIFKLFQNSAITSYNAIIDVVQATINAVIRSINQVSDAVNAASRAVGGANLLERVTEVDFTKARGTIDTNVKTLSEIVADAVKSQAGRTKGLFDQIVDQARKDQNADNDKSGFNRTAELQKVNAGLDTQIATMGRLADARKVDTQLASIEETFTQASIKSRGKIKALNDTEISSIRSKLQAIQDFNRTQQATDRIYEQLVGTELNYQATITATRKLVGLGVITQAQANREILKSKDAVANTLNPWKAYNDNLKNTIALQNSFGDQLSVLENVQAEVTAQRSKGNLVDLQGLLILAAQARGLQDIARLQNAKAASDDKANGALRDFLTGVKAANANYASGTITLAQYTGQVNQLSESFQNANDPLRQFFKSQQDQLSAANTDGIQTEILNSQLSAYSTLQQQGAASTDFATFAMSNQGQQIAKNVVEIDKAGKIKQATDAIITDVTANDIYINNMQQMYDRLATLRDGSLEGERHYQTAVLQLQAQSFAARTAGASSALSGIASLMSSKNRQLFNIGKAAALANAAIQGTTSVMNALAVPPYPLGVALAIAAGVAAAANIATIAQQQPPAFATGGTMVVGGKAGVDTNLVQMAVTRGERITVETAAQQQRVNNLVANDNKGGTTVQSTKIVNVFSQEEALAAMNSPEGEQVILNTLTRNSSRVSKIAQSG